MKHLKLFENFSVTEEQIEENFSVTEEQIEDWLKKNCKSNWFDSELQDRVSEYVGKEEAEDYDGDSIEAYKNLATGGAVEYDLLSVMNKMVCSALSIPQKYAYDEAIDKRSVSDICHDHLIDNCEWYDRFVFNRRSTEPYKSPFDVSFGTDFDSDIKL